MPKRKYEDEVTFDDVMALKRLCIRYTKLYNTLPICGFNRNEVHMQTLGLVSMLALPDRPPLQVRFFEKEPGEIPLLGWIEYDGVRFFTLLTYEEILQHNIAFEMPNGECKDAYYKWCEEHDKASA